MLHKYRIGLPIFLSVVVIVLIIFSYLFQWDVNIIEERHYVLYPLILAVILTIVSNLAALAAYVLNGKSKKTLVFFGVMVFINGYLTVYIFNAVFFAFSAYPWPLTF